MTSSPHLAGPPRARRGPCAERTFRAMGSDCHVLVATLDAHGEIPSGAQEVTEELACLAIERVELLEACWSRFRPTSELNRLNASAGRGPIPVSADLYLLVDRMAQAWTRSAGRFDPTVLTSMTALGYDADFAAVAARPSAPEAAGLGPAPGMSGVVLDRPTMTVTLPSGVGIDPGAIGKGLAADLVVADLMAAGATGALVNLGGDIALAGAAGDGAPWTIGVEDERRSLADPGRILRMVELPVGGAAAGIATSTTLKRRWAQGRRHHVIDPRTGTMAMSDLVQVTVVAAEAWIAEVTATTAILMGADEAERWLADQGIAAILLTIDSVIMTMEEAHAHA